MFSNRQISENFEVQINTLYNWRKTKPKLYRYLQNADANLETYKEVNVLLDDYVKDMQKDFTVEEIEYFIDHAPKIKTLDEIKNMAKIFVTKEYLKIPKEKDLIFSLYDKISQLDTIQKYVFFKKVYKVLESKKDPQAEEINIKNFFKGFIKE